MRLRPLRAARPGSAEVPEFDVCATSARPDVATATWASAAALTPHADASVETMEAGAHVYEREGQRHDARLRAEPSRFSTPPAAVRADRVAVEASCLTSPRQRRRSSGPIRPQREIARPGTIAQIELLVTILLAIATVATAWTSYQSARWSGVQTINFSRANAARVESTAQSTLAGQQTQLDVATFIAWTGAYAANDTTLSDFYFKRFRAEFKPAVDAWVATKPLKNPAAPLTPFAMPQYHLAAQGKARALARTAEAATREAKIDNQRSDNYVLAVVLFASVAVLCRHQHQARGRPLPRLDRRIGLHALLRDTDLARDVPRVHIGLISLADTTAPGSRALGNDNPPRSRDRRGRVAAAARVAVGADPRPEAASQQEHR